MIKPYLLVAMMFFLLLGPGRSQAFGGDITLAITTATTVIHTASGGASADQAGIKVTITNRGNESARNLSLQARLFDRKQAVAVAPRLPPGKSVDIAFTMPVPRSLNGSFPLFLEVFYQHPDGRTVSAGSLAVLTTTQREHPPVVALALEQKPSGLGAFVTVHLSTKDPALKEVRLTCYAPAALTVEQGQQMVRMDNGTGTTTFSIAPAKGDLGHYAVFVATEAEVNGSHELVSSSMVVPAVAAKSLVDRVDRATWQRAGYGAAILVLLLWFWSLLPGRRTTADEAGWHTSPRDTGLVDTVVLAAVIIFIIINLNPQYLVTSTVTTGGDTASHYYTLDYLRHQLLPHGKISGWTMGNYAGFPLLQFYFPLPFLLMCLLNVAIPLTVAFKIVTLLGTLLLPITAYLLLRGLQRPFPAPILGAIFTLPFLFHSANSMWGGNILSTLAGEFSYSLSLSLSLILLGAMYYGARHERWVIGNAVLVFLVGFSHGYTLLFVEAVSMFLLIVHDGFIRRFIYLLKVYTLGFLFLAFWLVPLLVFTRFTTSYHLAWTINSWREIVPPQILPFAILAAVGSVVMLWWSGRRRRDSELVTALAYLWFGCIASIVFFIAAPRLGVVDIRYVPYGQLLAVITAALFLGWLTRFLPKNGPLWTIPLLCMLGVFIWIGGNPGPAPGWAKWNYEGFEAKPAWPLFKQINSALQGGVGDPRVMYEHSEDHTVFGSSRAFESLPLFAGRATLEGLYMQASISAPFVFYLQSEISTVKSAPFPQYEYANMNFARALPHLCMFNVGELVIRSAGAKQAIRTAAGYRLKETIGEYELWDVTANSGHYVEPLAFEPVLFTADNWKTDSYRWFMNGSQLDVHLVFDLDKSAQREKRFKAQARDLSALPRIPIDTTNCRIKETIGNDEILIKTNWIGKPLLVKVSYHPDWKVEGADRIYLVSPSFMLIYPTKSTVRLHYGRGWPDRAGAAMTILGLAILLLNLPVVGRKRTTLWRLAAVRFHIPPSLVPDIRTTLPVRVRKSILAASLVIAAFAVGWFCYYSITSDTNRLFNSAVKYKDAKQYDKAIASFRAVAADQPFSNLSQDSAYYIAICYYLEEKNTEAIAAFRSLIGTYPKSLWVPEAWYHIGLCQFRLGRLAEGVATMNRVIRDYPGAEWANYAVDRLAEKGMKPVEGTP